MQTALRSRIRLGPRLLACTRQPDCVARCSSDAQSRAVRGDGPTHPRQEGHGGRMWPMGCQAQQRAKRPVGSAQHRPAATRQRLWGAAASGKAQLCSHHRSQLAHQRAQANVTFACKAAHVRPLPVGRTTWWLRPCATGPRGLSTRAGHVAETQQKRVDHGWHRPLQLWQAAQRKGTCAEDPPPIARMSGQKLHGVTCDKPPVWRMKVDQRTPEGSAGRFHASKQPSAGSRTTEEEGLTRATRARLTRPHAWQPAGCTGSSDWPAGPISTGRTL